MRKSLLSHRSSRLVVAAFLAAALGFHLDSSRAQDGDELRVRVDAAPGPYVVGQGIDLRVAVVARDQRPKLELPTPADARLWVVDTSFKPISASGIGRNVSGDNLFLTRIRLVPLGVGTLDVPPVVARLDDQEGKSKPLRLKIENPPIEGRTSDFLGGVGPFSAEAEADVGQARVGQEFLYRIRVSGPAAWGMTSRPELARLRALPIAARVEALADQTINEPPERTFVFRVRPSRPGDVVLPPVSIASFDPKTKRYLTHATRGVPLKVVAVPSFDASKLEYRPAAASLLGKALVAMVWLAVGAGVVVVAIVAGRRVKRRWDEASRTGRGAARRFARIAASGLGERADESPAETARRAIDVLVEYARLSVGRPPGALTPDEARAAITRGSGSDELGRGAARLAARCDRILFAESAGEALGEGGEAASLSRDARDLFTALGRSGGWRSPALVSGSRDATTA
ncbi:MAG: hypothetical protein P4L85_15365 [Paludisphaera borealis]|uniref:hypothetical protein n=1 Tax=Paludisphaera borealis TaxID=1387353 RepID=UPI00284794D5|nr:hypothetical protein [Paludisphaera borealis]MDR3620730.1 hypothetical protein [Paludisphaera borealis]